MERKSATARIHNVHAREIAAPVEVVGEILDTLGSSGDRVWASDIWVAEPVVFERPLGVGADGGHGSLRYSVIEYEPGRRIVFEFSPDGALSGTHRFELEPLGAGRCRLTRPRNRNRPLDATARADPDRLARRDGRDGLRPR
jgi:hypothetical protein